MLFSIYNVNPRRKEIPMGADLVLEVLRSVGIDEPWEVIPVLLAMVVCVFSGKFWGMRVQKREHEQQEFLHTWLADRNRLDRSKGGVPVQRFRPFCDGNLNTLATDPKLAAAIRRAAVETTATCPGLRLRTPALQRQMWSDIYKVIGPQIDKDQPPMIMIPTCEAYTLMKNRGQRFIIRFMCITEEDLREYHDEDFEPQLENPVHDMRVLTLRWAATMWFDHKGLCPETNLRVAGPIESPWKD